MDPAARAALLWLALPALAAAQAGTSLVPPPGPAPETHKFHLSPYEQTTIDGALAALGLTAAADPETKVVESIHVVRLEVIEERDPAPRFLNVFHVLSRSEVVEREVLLHPGDVYRQTLADETRRNLAALPQLSLVVVAAARGSAPDRVRIVVVTKDIWSIRLNWSIAQSGSGLESLTLDPTETNLLGTHQSLGVRLDWLPLSHAIGAHYAVPRILGSRVAGFAEAGLVFDHGGSREGSYGRLDVSYPLWSSLTAWSWDVGFAWREDVARLYSNARLASFALDPRTSCDAPSALCVPFAYRERQVSAGASLTRSYGWSQKHDLSAGVQALRSRFETPDLSAYDAATVSAFRQTRVPASDDRVGPLLQYRSYSTSFLRVLDLETLALQEDHRLGPAAYLRLYALPKILGSSGDLLGVSAGSSLTAAVHDGLVRVGLESLAEVDPGTGAVRNGSVQAALRAATPRWAAGRVIVDGVLLYRYRNDLHRTIYLGGDSRLRGFPSNFVAGADLLAVNAEYRSRPVQLLRSVQLAGALFYDAGDAFDRWDALHLWQALGGGARILFPQLDRIVFRVDVGFPLARPARSGSSAAVFVSFGQAFPMPDIAPRSAASP